MSEDAQRNDKLDADPASYGLEVDGDCMDRVCPPGMVAVVQPGVAARSGDVVVATIDRAVHVEHVAYFQSREPF